MIVLGIDPDVKTPALALVTDEDGGRLLWVGVGRNKDVKGLKAGPVVYTQTRKLIEALPEEWRWNIDMLVLEGQEVYRSKTINPKDIVTLAAAAAWTGAAAASLLDPCDDGRLDIRIPLPKQWKHNLSKRVCQERAWERLGVSCTYSAHRDPRDRYCIPDPEDIKHVVRGSKVNKGDWMHLGDGMALGMWGLTKGNT